MDNAFKETKQIENKKQKTNILAINDFFVIRKKNEETELSFCSVTFFATAQIPADHSVSFWVEISS